MSLRLLPITHLAVERAKAEMGAGSEGAHAELVGLLKRMIIVDLRGVPVRRIGARGDLPEQAQGQGLVAPLLVLTGEGEGLLGGLPRIVQPAVAQKGLTEVDDTHGLAVLEKRGV